MRCLPRWALVDLRQFVIEYGTTEEKQRLCPAIDSVLKPRPSVISRRKKARAKREAGWVEDRKVRAEVFARADGRCEMPAAGSLRYGPDRCSAVAVDPHHVFGRAKEKQGPHNVLAVCRVHHDLLTLNEPSAEACWELVGQALRGVQHYAEAARCERNAQTERDLKALDQARKVAR